MLFPHLRGLRVWQVEDTGDAVVIRACCRGAQARCPACGTVSSRVHGGYGRVVADGAAGGRPVLIALSVRRFRCRERACPKATFAEQAEGVSARYRRRSVPLLGMLAGFGLELAGRAAARLAGALGMPVHSSTVLRLVMALPDPPVTAAPAVTGVDDFALRKGRVYGTVIADAVSGQVADLLPDREAATLQAWLQAHPGAEVICRDRAGAYAEGARHGAPGAVQVADRWHLWHNLGDYVGKAVDRHRDCLEEPQPAGPADAGPARAELVQRAADAVARRAEDSVLARRTAQRHELIQSLKARGKGIAQVMRETGLAKHTVRRFYHAQTAGELLATARDGRPSLLDGHKPYLHQRWNEGCTSITRLHAELKERGYTGSYDTIRGYVQPFRRLGAAPPAVPAPPRARDVASWILTHPDHLTDDRKTKLSQIRDRCPQLDALAAHVTEFAKMMTHRQGLLALEDWLACVEAGDQPELHSFARGIRRDQQAVTAGLALPYSSAAMEGNVNKIKMLKRQMYGRAAFPLLRKRVILHPA